MAAERHFTKMPDVPQGMEALMRIENAVMLRKFQWQGSDQNYRFLQNKQKYLHSLYILQSDYAQILLKRYLTTFQILNRK